MKTFIIINKETLYIEGSYQAEEKQDNHRRSSYLLDEPYCVHLELPDGLDESAVKAVKEGETISLVQDDEAIQAALSNQRFQKLALIRFQREARFEPVDEAHRQLIEKTREDHQQVAAYRQALKDITNPYKDEENNPTPAIDDLNDDLSNLEWPEVNL